MACAAIASLAPVSALACQGWGGDVAGAGGVSLADGSGGVGGNGRGGAQSGGAGGNLGGTVIITGLTNVSAMNGVAGGNGITGAGGSSGAGNGGGGGGFGTATNPGIFYTNSSTIQGGQGGNGGVGFNTGGAGCSEDGGGGGQGGGGVLLSGGTLNNSGGMNGASGGAGGAAFGAGAGGAGGSGGVGVSASGGATVQNTGTISGGNGGAGGSGGTTGSNGSGGAGVTLNGDGNTLVNAGTIAGGLTAVTNDRANAVTVTGNNNTVELRAGYVFNGNLVATGTGNTVGLGGGTNASFDMSAVGAGLQYSGFNSFQKTGVSTWTLTGTSTYSGATSVNAGTLSVNGSIANSAITVNNGGTLGGSGTVGSTTIASGGILAPGNSIGTLTVNGNLNIAAGSTYRVEVDAAGANDRVNVTGTATLNGGTVDVQASAGTYAANTSYTLLNATGGLTGTFAGVTSNLAFLTPTLGYTANNVSLSLARNNTSFSAVAVTPNQIATSTALQNFGSTGDAGTVQTALTGLSAAQARAAYDAASGAGITGLRRAGLSFAGNFGSQLQARLGSRGSSQGTSTAFSNRPLLLASADALAGLSELMAQATPTGNASPAAGSPDNAGRGFWLRGYGGYQNSDADNNAAASRQRDSGMSAGFDTQAGNGMRLGAALSAGTARLSTDNNETGKARNTALAVYGSYAAGPWSFSGSASYAWGSNHMDRNIVVGALNRTASGDFDSNTLAAYGEANYTVPMNGWTLQPLAALSLSRYKSDGFTETGAGALNLQVAGQTTTSTRTLLGARASFDTGAITLEPRLVWSHEFGDLNAPLTARFQGAGAAPFQVSGTALKRDALIVGLGAQGNISKGVTLFADVQAQVSSGQRSVAALVGLRSRW